MLQKWKSLSAAHKAATVLSVVTSALVALLAVLQLLHIWDAAIDVCIPLLGVVDLCHAYLQWNINRKSAYVSLAIAAFIFVCSAWILCS